MIQGKYLKQFLVSLGLILIFSSSATRSMSEYKFLTEYFFIIGGLLILGVGISVLIKRDIFLNNTFKQLTFIYVLFIILVVVSTLINQNLYTEIDSVVKLFLIYLFLGVGLTLTEVVTKGMIIKSFVISSVLIFTFFLIEYPISGVGGEAYKGAFNNENSVGVLGVTLFSVSLVAGLSLFKRKQHFILASVYLLIAIGASYLVLISNSRTSFVTLVLVLGIVASIFLYDALKERDLLSWEGLFTTLFVLITGVTLFIFINNPVYTLLESTILDKFAKQIESGRLTDGRVDIWTEIVNNAHLFEREEGYIMDVKEMGAHNSFMHMLSHYSWVSAIFYAIFWVIMLIKSIHYYLKEKLTDTYALLPLVVVINFYLVSIMENMTVHVSATLAISMVAIFSKKKVGRLRYSSRKSRQNRMERLHTEEMQNIL